MFEKAKVLLMFKLGVDRVWPICHLWPSGLRMVVHGNRYVLPIATENTACRDKLACLKTKSVILSSGWCIFTKDARQ